MWQLIDPFSIDDRADPLQGPSGEEKRVLVMFGEAGHFCGWLVWLVGWFVWLVGFVCLVGLFVCLGGSVSWSIIPKYELYEFHKCFSISTSTL